MGDLKAPKGSIYDFILVDDWGGNYRKSQQLNVKLSF